MTLMADWWRLARPQLFFPGRRAAAVCAGGLSRRGLHDDRAGRCHQAAVEGWRRTGLLQPLARIPAQRLGSIVSHANNQLHNCEPGLSRESSAERGIERWCKTHSSLCQITAIPAQTRNVLLQVAKQQPLPNAEGADSYRSAWTFRLSIFAFLHRAWRAADGKGCLFSDLTLQRRNMRHILNETTQRNSLCSSTADLFFSSTVENLAFYCVRALGTETNVIITRQLLRLFVFERERERRALFLSDHESDPDPESASAGTAGTATLDRWPGHYRPHT